MNSASGVASASEGGAMKNFIDEETNVIVVIIHLATAAKKGGDIEGGCSTVEDLTMAALLVSLPSSDPPGIRTHVLCKALYQRAS